MVHSCYASCHLGGDSVNSCVSKFAITLFAIAVLAAYTGCEDVFDSGGGGGGSGNHDFGDNDPQLAHRSITISDNAISETPWWF